jgi:hypothetical protein
MRYIVSKGLDIQSITCITYPDSDSASVHKDIKIFLIVPPPSIHDQSDVYQRPQSWPGWAGTHARPVITHKTDHLESLHCTGLLSGFHVDT